MIVTDQELKQYFQTGDFPTQQQFYNFIDSKINVGSPLLGTAIGDTITGGTIGSVLFLGSGSTLEEDNANFFWDDTNKRLGLGTILPGSRIHLKGDTNADPKPLQIRYERPAGSFNSNTNWISQIATQNFIDVGFLSLAQQAVGQGTRWSFAVTSNTAVTATEGMRLSQTKQLSIGNTINDGAVVDIFSKGLLSTDIALRVRNNGNTFDDFKVNGAGQTQIGNGATISTSALLQLDSKNKGFLFPRMTTAERDAISSPANGLFIWNTTTDALNVYKSSTGTWRHYNDNP